MVAARHCLFAVLLLVGGCASLTPYQPLTEGLGFTEQKIESNRYRISFTASSRTPAATVEGYLLRRAAELTLAESFDYFLIADQAASGAPRSRSPVSIGVGGYGGSYGSGIGIGFGTGLGSGPPWQAYADVQMFAAPKPADQPRAYDARQVLANVPPPPPP